MSAVDEAIARQRSNIPQALRPQRRWLTWQRRPKRNRPGKFDKVPFYPDGRKRYGAQGRPEEREWLGEFEEAIEAYATKTTLHGVGLALLPDITDWALDLDDCIDGSGKLSDLAQRVVDSGTYCERSPSGAGLRALFAGKIGIDKKNHAAGVETFNSQGFVTMTGDRIGGESLLPCPPALLEEILATVRAGSRSKGTRGDTVLPLPPAGNPDAGNDVRLPLSIWKRLHRPYRKGCDRSREAFLIALDLNRAGLSAEQALALMARPDCDVLTPALERRGGDIESARVWLWKYVVAPAYQQGGTHGR
jgi:hypothetical protein